MRLELNEDDMASDLSHYGCNLIISIHGTRIGAQNITHEFSARLLNVVVSRKY